jgi:hypothetical protein
MSIATVVTMGYGNGTVAGNVNLLPTIGYSIGEVINNPTDGVKFARLNRIAKYDNCRIVEFSATDRIVGISATDRIAEFSAIDRFNDYD